METVISIIEIIFVLIVGIKDALHDENQRPYAIFCICWLTGTIIVEIMLMKMLFTQIGLLFSYLF